MSDLVVSSLSVCAFFMHVSLQSEPSYQLNIDETIIDKEFTLKFIQRRLAIEKHFSIRSVAIKRINNFAAICAMHGTSAECSCLPLRKT